MLLSRPEGSQSPWRTGTPNRPWSSRIRPRREVPEVREVTSVSTADQRREGCRCCDAKRISIASQCSKRCGDLPIRKELLMVPELPSQDPSEVTRSRAPCSVRINMKGMHFRGRVASREAWSGRVGEMTRKSSEPQSQPCPRLLVCLGPQCPCLSKGVFTPHLTGLAGMRINGRKGESLVLIKIANLT